MVVAALFYVVCWVIGYKIKVGLPARGTNTTTRTQCDDAGEDPDPDNIDFDPNDGYESESKEEGDLSENKEDEVAESDALLNEVEVETRILRS